MQDLSPSIDAWNALIGIASFLLAGLLTALVAWWRSRGTLADTTNDQVQVLLEQKNIEIQRLRYLKNAYRSQCHSCARDYFEKTGDTAYLGYTPEQDPHGDEQDEKS